jgi:NADH-quinone oxidoreductase subunit N
MKRASLESSEFYGLVLFAVAGMMLMASSADLIVTFIALETFSIALYVLVGFRTRSLVSQESAMKYFLLGAFSSAFFLLGIALVYGVTGSTNLYGVADSGSPQGIVQYLTTTPPTDVGILVVAVGFLIVGLGFKVAAVPFHMWTPDAYQGAPSPVTGFMAAGTKLAAFAALLRLLDVSLFQLRDDWRPLVLAVATATMVVGSLFAVVQEDVKRILAYSSIAHAGFVFTAIVATNDRGISGALFYLVTYGLTVVGAFAIVAVVGGRDENRTRLSDYKGLFYQRPLLAGALTLFLLSLAGVPLTSGFVAKLVVFGPAVDAGYAWLVVIGAIASAIAAFFYLRIMVVMYMQEPDEGAPQIAVGPLAGAVVGITALATVVVFFAWSPV